MQYLRTLFDSVAANLARASQQAVNALSLRRFSTEWQQWILLAIAFISALMIRNLMLPHLTGDFTFFMLPWFEYLEIHGFYGLGDEFADYNVPYLYLLYITTKLPLDALEAVKVISGFFDLFLALGVVAIVQHLVHNRLVAFLAGTTFLFVPEVLLNSAFWGQTDGIFTSFLVWMAYFLLVRRDILAWICFALAFEFKLQALFLLPWLLIAFIVQKHRWRAVGYGIVAALIAYIPALIAGRSVESLAAIYLSQSQTYANLTSRSPSLYQWIPNSNFDIFQPAGMFFALGIVSIVSIVFLRRASTIENPRIWLLQVGASYGMLVPFVLPQMHDRYFYAGGVLVVICAVLNRKYVAPALIVQFNAVMTYSGSIFNTSGVVPLGVGAIIQLGVISWILWLSFSAPQEEVSASYFQPIQHSGPAVQPRASQAADDDPLD